MLMDAATSRQDFPERYVNRAHARQKWGAMADRYAGYLNQTDPLADAVVEAFGQLEPGRGHRLLARALDFGIAAVPEAPEALKQLFAQVERLPDWVDFDLMDVGARAYQRTGGAAPLVLSAWSLMNGYHSGPAVKPLAYTKQLDAMAPRRLAETGRFVIETVQLGGLRRFAPGFKIAVKVRIMHALVRQMLWRSGEWNQAAWGAPINQGDMAGTVIEFSGLMLGGTRQLGYRFTRREAEAIVHLWRYSGYLSGVDEGLLRHFDSEANMHEFAEMMYSVQPGPDEDSLALAAALRKTPLTGAKTKVERALAPLLMRTHDGFTWLFNGSEMSRDLRIPNPAWRNIIYPVRALVGALETTRALIPGGNTIAAQAGNAMVRAQVERMLAKDEPTFVPKRAAIPPEQIRKAASAPRAA